MNGTKGSVMRDFRRHLQLTLITICTLFLGPHSAFGQGASPLEDVLKQVEQSRKLESKRGSSPTADAPSYDDVRRQKEEAARQHDDTLLRQSEKNVNEAIESGRGVGVFIAPR